MINSAEALVQSELNKKEVITPVLKIIEQEIYSAISHQQTSFVLPFICSTDTKKSLEQLGYKVSCNPFKDFCTIISWG